MSDSSSPTDERSEPGAPVAKDAIDPELIKLRRKPSTSVGIITAAGVVFLCIVFLFRLHGDRVFSDGDQPRKVTVEDVAAGKVAADSYVTLTGEPMRSHAIRVSRSQAGLGLRVLPMRGTSDQVWVVLGGDGWDPANMGAYTGRLRKLEDLAFADALLAHARANPRPVFATIPAARAGFATNQVTTVTGQQVTVAPGDRVAMDVTDPGVAMIVAAFNERLPNAQVWTSALRSAGLDPGTPIAPPPGQRDQIRFVVAMPDAVASVTKKLEAANLWAARVEPITRHHETTWATLQASATQGTLQLDGQTVPDAAVDLVGLYVARDIPAGAYAVIVGENPQDYWYVMPITVALAVILLLFAWALVRAVRRDVLPPRAA